MSRTRSIRLSRFLVYSPPITHIAPRRRRDKNQFAERVQRPLSGSWRL